MTQRAWCFTLNNPDGLLDFDDFADARYLVYQMELAPTTNTPHFQGYVEFDRPKRLSAVRRILNAAHWEPRRATRDEARAYCMKLETRIDGPYESGIWEIGGQGARSDVYSLHQMIKSEKSEEEILESMPLMWFRFHNAITKAKLLVAQKHKRTEKTEVFLFLGPPGTGKSLYCAQNYPGAYWKSQDQWWDGYAGEETVILDEFYGWLRYSELLRMLDAYPMQVQVKGGFVNFAPKRIIITSNKQPWDWYNNDKIHWDYQALYRRIEHAWWFPELDVPPIKYDTFSELEANHYPRMR